MLSVKKLLLNCIAFNSAFALTLPFSQHLCSQESAYEQLVSFGAGDGDSNIDRKKADKGRKKPQEKQNSQRSRPRHTEPSFAPANPEVLELLSSISRSLKSIESMMREENNQDRMRPEQTPQFNRMPQSFGPQSFGPQMLGPQFWRPNPANRNAPQQNNQQNRIQNQPSGEPANQLLPIDRDRAPRSVFPPNASRRNDGPRNDGPRNDGQRGDGPRNDGPRNDGPRNDGPRNDGPRNDGPRNDGPRNDGPRNDGPRNDGPRDGGPRDGGPTYDGQPRNNTEGSRN